MQYYYVVHWVRGEEGEVRDRDSARVFLDLNKKGWTTNGSIRKLF